MPKASNVKYLNVGYEHTGFDVSFHDSDAKQLTPAERIIYDADRSWGAVFIQCRDNERYGASDLLSWRLSHEHKTFKDHIPPDKLAEAERLGTSSYVQTFPLTFSPGSFQAMTDAGPADIATLDIKLQVTVSFEKRENVIQTDKPFASFSQQAGFDYLSARTFNLMGMLFGGSAGYSGHQACEKYMKALTVQSEGEFDKGHKLKQLAERCARLNPYFRRPTTLRTLAIFDRFSEVGRYGAHAQHDPMVAPNARGRVAGAWVWSPGYLTGLDGFVWTLRTMLNERKDFVKCILDNEPEAYFKDWGLGTSARDILLRDNLAFR